jgi:hypothetical protein
MAAASADGSTTVPLPPTCRRLCQDGGVDYDLTRLGDREFEHLSQALALQVAVLKRAYSAAQSVSASICL